MVRKRLGYTKKSHHLTEKREESLINMKTKTLVVSGLGIAAFLGVSTSTFAENVTQLSIPFDAVVTSGHPQLGGTCTDINWPLHFVGSLHVVVHDTVANGVHHFVVEEGIHGDATDAAGNDYVFSYNNSLKATFASSLGDSTSVDFDTDSFNMEGAAGHLHVSFSGSLIFDANGNWVSADLSHIVGNVSCDPL